MEGGRGEGASGQKLEFARERQIDDDQNLGLWSMVGLELD